MNKAKLLKFEKVALSLMKKWGLIEAGWDFRYNNRKRALGVCRYSFKLIEMSKNFVDLNSEEEIRDTILHEIAHAKAGSMAKHGRKWKLWAIEVGAKPETCATGIVMTYRYEIYCNGCESKLKGGFHRRPTKLHKSKHRNCGGSLVAIDTNILDSKVKEVIAARKVKSLPQESVTEVAKPQAENVSRQAEYDLNGSEYLIVQFTNKSILITLKGEKVVAKVILRAIADKEGMSYKKDQHQRTLANNLLNHLA